METEVLGIWDLKGTDGRVSQEGCKAEAGMERLRQKTEERPPPPAPRPPTLNK